MADLEKPGQGHPTEEQLVWHYYGEDAASAEVDLHLTLCRQCREEFEGLKLTMKTIEAWPIPERGPGYGEDVWLSLRKRDASFGKPLPWWQQWIAPKRLMLAGSVAAMLIAAFFVGRVSHQIEQPELATSSQVVRERVLAAALSEHLEASQRVLLELTNSEAGQGLDVSEEQRRAESLLKSNRLYRVAAAREGEGALATVLDDLERVLLDVARGPSELTPGELKELRSRMEDQGLLFKVRVLELRLKELQDQPVRHTRKAGKEMKG